MMNGAPGDDDMENMDGDMDFDNKDDSPDEGNNEGRGRGDGGGFRGGMRGRGGMFRGRGPHDFGPRGMPPGHPGGPRFRGRGFPRGMPFRGPPPPPHFGGPRGRFRGPPPFDPNWGPMPPHGMPPHPGMMGPGPPPGMPPHMMGPGGPMGMPPPYGPPPGMGGPPPNQQGGNMNAQPVSMRRFPRLRGYGFRGQIFRGHGFSRGQGFRGQGHRGQNRIVYNSEKVNSSKTPPVVKKKVTTINPVRSKGKEWVTEDLKKLMDERDILFRKAKYTKSKNKKMEYQKTYKVLRNKVNMLIKKKKLKFDDIKQKVLSCPSQEVEAGTVKEEKANADETQVDSSSPSEGDEAKTTVLKTEIEKTENNGFSCSPSQIHKE